MKGCSMKKIVLFDIFRTKTLRNRDTATSITQNLRSSEIVEIDFADIEFASRSFCHELFVGIKKKQLNVKIINANEQVQQMFRISGANSEIIA